MRGLLVPATLATILAAGSATAQEPPRAGALALPAGAPYDALSRQRALAGPRGTGTEDRARQIIEGVIERKRDALDGIRAYQYDGYVRFSARNLGKPPDSAESILLIRETRSRVYWERPGRYQETILARRQSNDLDLERNLVSVGEIVDLHRDRIELEKYSMVSPMADDALEYYRYAILDTLALDEGQVLRLAIRPRTEAIPLFVGVMDVLDSTYEVLAIDVGVNSAARFTYAADLRYQQRFRATDEGWWMPYEVRLTGVMRLSLGFPGMPRNVAFGQVALLEHFRSDAGDRPPDLGRVRVVVDSTANGSGGTNWDAPSAVPLTVAERAAWARIDSIARGPDLRRRVGRALGFVASSAADPDFFRFNRVEGAYVGAAREWRELPVPGAVWTTRLGYGFASDAWQYGVGGRLPLLHPHAPWVGVAYHDGTMRRPTFVSSSHNPTLLALLERLDPLDYYRERGWTLSAGAKLMAGPTLELHVHDVRQSSLPVATEFALLGADRPQRPNPPIVDGRLRSMEARLNFDSRPLRRSQGVEDPLPTLPSTRLSVAAELADPELMANDFTFRRFTVELVRRQRTRKLGTTTVSAAVGVATGDLPPQRYFGVDFGPDVGYQGIAYQGHGFDTLGETSFSGNRATMLIVHHDFDRLLLLNSRSSLVRGLPFTLSAHGGVFWTDFVNHASNPADSLLSTARSPYVEVGFGVGNLTPFLSPFNLHANLTWQLSSHPTRRFRFGLDLTP